MRPAFSTARSAAAFMFLLLAILLSPVLLSRSCLPPRELGYSSAPWAYGAFPYLQDQIFHEKEDIDVVFMGSSTMWWGIDTPYVEEELQKKLGRKPVVRSLCWNWNGFDALYFITRDLLAHRKVHMIVFHDVNGANVSTPHVQAAHWFRFGDDAADLAGIPTRSKIGFYGAAVCGLPRQLLGLVRSDLPAIAGDKIAWDLFSGVKNPVQRLGSLNVRAREGIGQYTAEYVPPSRPDPDDAVIYSDATKDRFHFQEGQVTPMQAAFARKFAALACANGVQLVCLHLNKRIEMESPQIEEAAFWPDVLGADVPMVGVPSARLFEGLSADDIQRLYYDVQHFNADGSRYFTPAVTPRLIKLYETQTGH